MSEAIVPLKASDALVSEQSYRADWDRWKSLIGSGVLPKHVTRPEVAIALARFGEELGWGPMRSVRSLYQSKSGNIEMYAQDMLALIRERCPEAKINPVEASATACIIEVWRPGMDKPFRQTVTAEQYQHLIKPTKNGHKSPWQLYTDDLLWARCVSKLSRRIFPDIVRGVYIVGETDGPGWTVQQQPRDAEADLFGEPQPPEDFDDQQAVDTDWSETDAIDGPPEDEDGQE